MAESNEKPQPATVQELYEAALKLSTEEREKLYLMLSQEDERYTVDPAAERAIIEECERRVQMVREGKMELIDADEVIRKAKAILDQAAK